MEQLSSIVDFETAKLLKEKGFYKVDTAYYDKGTNLKTYKLTYCQIYSPIWHSHTNNYKNLNTYLAPKIATVIDWIYNKHKMWVSTFPSNYKHHWKIDGKDGGYLEFSKNGGYNSPKEAYIEAIKYVLKELI
jgi:hypothetical protein